MSRRIINVGQHGNDATGDSIRLAFSKVNENFKTLYAAFGVEGDLTFKSLEDTPNNYSAGQIFYTESENFIGSRTLEAGDGIVINSSIPGKLIIGSSSGLSNDAPTIANHLNAKGFIIANVAQPDDPQLESKINEWNFIHASSGAQIDLNSLLISKRYADNRYVVAGGLIPISIRTTPTTSSAYIRTITDISIDGNAIIPSHGFASTGQNNGDEFRFEGTAIPLTSGAVYYIRYVNANELSLHTTKAGATTITPAARVSLTDLGAGPNTIAKASYNPLLSGFWLEDEAVRRSDVTLRSGDTMTGFLTLSADPTDNLHAATKQYVDSADDLKLNVSGGTMTGFLTLSADPTDNLHAATKQYVDSTKLALAGGTMTGYLTLNATPTANLHAATKQYVDVKTSTTDAIPEGSTNLYYTGERVDDRVADLLLAGPNISIEYNDDADVIVISASAAAGYDLTNNSTDDLSEGSNNLYFTELRATVAARNSLSVTTNVDPLATPVGALSYDATTGEFSYTPVTVNEIRDVVSGGTGVTYDSATGVISVGQDVSTVSDVVFNALELTSGVITVPLGVVTVDGNLITNGIEVKNNLLYLSSNSQTPAEANSSGIYINGANASFIYSASSGSWVSSNDIVSNLIGQVSDISNHSSDDLAEGSVNLYFTYNRAIEAARSGLNVVSNGLGSLEYDDSTGTFTYTGLTNLAVGYGLVLNDTLEVNRLLVITRQEFDLFKNNLNNRLENFDETTTDNIAEGSVNLYFTYNRAIEAARSGLNVVSNGLGSLEYDDSTGTFTYTAPPLTVVDGGGDGYLEFDSTNGVFTYTGPSATEVRAHFTAGDDVSIVDGQVSVISSTSSTPDSVVKRTASSDIECSRIFGTPVLATKSLLLDGTGIEFTPATLTENIITVSMTDNDTITVPTANSVPGRWLIVRNRSTVFTITIATSSSTVTTILPSSHTQLMSDGVSWFVL
jgi:hypothetical protein